MGWQDHGMIWIAALPAVFLLAWTLAELRKRRALQDFGDPRVLGLSFRWTPHVLGALLLAATLGCTTAALVNPDRSEEDERGPLLTELLLDAEAFDRSHPLSGQYWEHMRSAVGQIGARSGLVSLYRSGASAEKMVPATTDLRGLEILIRRHQMLWQSSSATSLEQSVDSLLRRPSADKRSRRLVVFTARPLGDIEDLRVAADGTSAGGLVYVRLPTVTDAMQYGFRNTDGSWIWEPARLGFPVVSGGGTRNDAPLWGHGQFFSFIAFICLMAESLLVLWPANVEY